MKRLCLVLLMLCALMGAMALAEDDGTAIVISEAGITVNGAEIPEDDAAPVYLSRVTKTHADVPEALQDVVNRVVNITAAGRYRISGEATDVQIVVRAGGADSVRLILDGVDLTCRTAPTILGLSAMEPGTPGEYGLTIELADGPENRITGSHAAKNADGVKYDGAIDAMVSLGFEGSGSLTVNADNEGIEVQRGHMTINGGVFHVYACDDPLNVSEDGVGVLTVNDGYLFSSVKNIAGGEGDGIDSNGSIVFNGGTAINLAHPSSADSGIDSDMGSTINGGVIVGAGNMYDPIDSASQQLFMMLEFAQKTEDLLVVTDADGVPVFAYDFPYDYTYIAFSTPTLTEGETYHVYLGGEIEGEEQDGLYTTITAYTPGTLMQHGGGTASASRTGMMPPEQGGADRPMDMPPDKGFDPQALSTIDLNELLAGVDLNELLEGKDLNGLLTGFSLTDLLPQEQIDALLSAEDRAAIEGMGGRGMGGFGGGMGGRSMESSAETSTPDFVLTSDHTGFTNVNAGE